MPSAVIRWAGCVCLCTSVGLAASLFVIPSAPAAAASKTANNTAPAHTVIRPLPVKARDLSLLRKAFEAMDAGKWDR